MAIAEAQAKALGFPKLRVVLVEHPISGLDDRTVSTRALAVLPAVVTALTGR